MAKTTRKLHREYDNDRLVRKECRACATILSIDRFYVKGTKSQTNIDGYENKCIECHKAVWRKKAEDPEARKRWLLERIRAKCKTGNIPFNLTINDLDIPDTCPVFGMPLKFGISRGQSYRGPAEDSPSVDRIDPDKGYTKGNIVIVSWRANRMKMNASLNELQTLASFYTKLAAK
jgi:hypothetical protein